jgi:hypothetical protein
VTPYTASQRARIIEQLSSLVDLAFDAQPVLERFSSMNHRLGDLGMQIWCLVVRARLAGCGAGQSGGGRDARSRVAVAVVAAGDLLIRSNTRAVPWLA